MVYRDLSMEEAQTKFTEITATVVPVEKAPAPKPKRKVVKALVPKST